MTFILHNAVVHNAASLLHNLLHITVFCKMIIAYRGVHLAV